jgi:hypothetical protein
VLSASVGTSTVPGATPPVNSGDGAGTSAPPIAARFTIDGDGRRNDRATPTTGLSLRAARALTDGRGIVAATRRLFSHSG